MILANLVTTKIIRSDAGYDLVTQEVNKYLAELPDNAYLLDIKYADGNRFCSAMVMTVQAKSPNLEDIPYR